MSLLAKVKAVKLAKAGRVPALKTAGAKASTAISSILKGGNKIFSTALSKATKSNVSAGNKAQAFIKKLNKNKGIVK